MLISLVHRYGLQERCRHGEAGSVDLAAVAEEHKQLSKILAEYPKKKCTSGSGLSVSTNVWQKIEQVPHHSWVLMQCRWQREMANIFYWQVKETSLLWENYTATARILLSQQQNGMDDICLFRRVSLILVFWSWCSLASQMDQNA